MKEPESNTVQTGGPLTIRCPVCEAGPGVACITAPYSLGARYPLRKPHVARVRAASKQGPRKVREKKS